MRRKKNSFGELFSQKHIYELALEHNRCIDVVKKVLELDENFGIGNENVMETVAKNKNPKIFEMLVDMGAANLKNVRALLNAIASGVDETIQKLINSGIKINGTDEIEKQLLMDAAYYRDTPELIQQLVELGADVNATNESGWTALMCAVSENNVNTVKKLIELGADVSVEDKNGYTLLDYADKECEEIIKDCLNNKKIQIRLPIQ